MDQRREVTIREVAERSRVSIFSVSCALRGKKGVSAETRERVKRVAEELGYQASSAARILAERRRQPSAMDREKVGMLAGPLQRDWWEAMQRACAKRGYLLDRIGSEEFGDFGRSAERLWKRGISGLIFHPEACPFSEEELRQFKWRKFAVVKLARGYPDLKFPTVRLSAFSYACKALENVFENGYNRVAVILSNSMNKQDDGARLGAVLNYQATELKPDQQLEWRHVCTVGQERIASVQQVNQLNEWLKRFKPQAVVVFPFDWFWKLEEMGWLVPRDFSLAAMVLPSEEQTIQHLAGCDRRTQEIVEGSLALLERQLRLGQTGERGNPEELVVDPIWRQGSSLPRAATR